MQIARIVSELDTEIARLKEARALLTGTTSSAVKTRTATPPRKSRRRLSAEGRRRIAEAMKKRWAERKKRQSAKSK